ncbi:MAG: hypothetical protein QW707_10230 [Candidatus Bathyarchaeia archaeon]
MAKVFLAPGFFRNIKRSVIDGVAIGEMDVRDPLLKKRLIFMTEDNVTE